MITGHIHTGAVTQDITAGGELFLRSVQQPGFYTAQNPVRSERHRAGWRGLHLRRLGKHLSAHRARSVRDPIPKARSNPPARAASGKTAIRPPAVIRTASIFPAASSSSPAAATIPCATTTTPLTRSPIVPSRPCPSPAHRQARLAAAIRRHLQPRREPHALLELRRDALARPASAVVGRQRQPVSRALLHAPGRSGRKVRARPAHSAHRRVLPHARAVLLSRRAMAAPADSTLSRAKAARRTTASNSTPKAKPPTGCASTPRPRP